MHVVTNALTVYLTRQTNLSASHSASKCCVKKADTERVDKEKLDEVWLLGG